MDIYQDNTFFLLFHGTHLAGVLLKRSFKSPADLQSFSDRCHQISQSPIHAFPVELPEIPPQAESLTPHSREHSDVAKQPAPPPDNDPS
jgi:hypothetical protein